MRLGAHNSKSFGSDAIRNVKVTVSVKDDSLRERILSALTAYGFELVGVLTGGAYGHLFGPRELLILETGDDMEALSDTVDALYLANDSEGTLLPIIAIASAVALDKNRRFDVWMKDGHAAVLALVSPEDFRRYPITGVVARFAQNLL